MKKACLSVDVYINKCCLRTIESCVLWNPVEVMAQYLFFVCVTLEIFYVYECLLVCLYFGTGIVDGCDLHCEYWEPNPCHLQEQ